ncbi:MAG: DUF2782 domain-containing protein [Pseudomonadales bacterium]|nr:DUF2782 domain-containing protein [Pseudomonadales bacterium]
MTLRNIIIAVLALTAASHGFAATPEELRNDDIEIIEDEDRTIYEYRTNGVLMIIKVVPKIGPPYYMVPADGSPHYKSLDYSRKLYPQWVIIEW